MKHYYILAGKDEYLIAQVKYKNIINYQRNDAVKNDILFKDSWYRTPNYADSYPEDKVERKNYNLKQRRY